MVPNQLQILSSKKSHAITVYKIDEKHIFHKYVKPWIIFGTTQNKKPLTEFL